MEDTIHANSTVAATTPLAPLSAEARLIGQRYLVAGRVRSDRASERLLAADTVTDSTVVIRWLAISDPSSSARLRLEHEAEVLSKLDKPWLRGVLEIGREAEGFYVVQPYVPGITLRRRLLRGPLDVQDALTVGRCLFSALKDSHQQGILHDDIRPANVIVGDESPLRGAVLIDFSLGLNAGAGVATAHDPLEAALYSSPEHAGSMDYEVGPTSDLYSAGIVLFECLAGHPPFDGDTMGAVLLGHMTSRVPELRAAGLSIPRSLEELIERLLRKDPHDRYQTAEAVLFDLEGIAASLDGGTAESAYIVGLHDRRPTLTEPAFIGHEDELEQVDEQIRQVAEGHASLVFVEAESGGGKTRFLVEMGLRGVQAKMWVLRGRGLEMVGGRPFQVLHGIVEDVVERARSDASFAKTLHERLGENAEAVAAVLPELARSLGWKESAAAGPEGFVETWSIQALAAFLDALGAKDRPALIILDDCQWADETTVKLMAHWQRERTNSGADSGPALLAVAFRSEEVAADHPLRMIHPTLHLRLAPFVAEELQRLLESMAGPLPAEAVEVVSKLSGGSPFMACAVLRGMVESGALLAEPAGWRIEPLALDDLQSSSQAAGLLSRRIELLPQDTLDLLTVGAVLGKEFDLNLAAQLLLTAPSQAVTALDLARARHFVWMQSDEAECIFVHDKIRVALLDRLSLETRQELHHRIAHHLREEDAGRIFDLAYHFDAAGDHESALPYALQAAEQARAQYALEIAERQYRIAQRGAHSAERLTRYGIAEGLGDVLMLRGRYNEAAELFQTALDLAEGTFAGAQIRGKLGELDFKRGHMSRAAVAYEEALRLLGKPVPQNTAVCVLAVLREVAIQVAHTLLPRLFVNRHDCKPSEPELLRLHLLIRLAYANWFSRGKVQTFLVHLFSMNLAERYAPTTELAHIYSSHAVAITAFGLFGRALAYAQKSLDIRRSLGDAWGEGQSLSFLGCVLYAASRFDECLEKCREAVRVLGRTGDYWEMHLAYYQVPASLYRLGDLRGAFELAQYLHKSGIELGDAQASSRSLDLWALASVGNVPEEFLKQEAARERTDAQAKAHVLLAQGIQMTAAGQHEQAAAAFERAIVEAMRLGRLNAYVVPNWPWLATALRRQAESQTDLTPIKRTELLARAEVVARRAVHIMQRFQNDLPHALREYARILALRGKVRRACRLLKKSLAVAQRQGAKYEYAQTLLAYGRLRRELGWAGANEQVAAAEATLRAIRVAVEDADPIGRNAAAPATLSLVDRFDTVLEEGRQITSALFPPMIFAEVRTAALRLLRGEHCLVLEAAEEEGQERFVPIAGSVDLGFNGALLRRALEAGKAVAFSGEPAEEAARRGALSEERSTLCAPIFVRGRVAACLYVAHYQVQCLFGADEERLADFIATIAGAALENAEGFQQLQQLNETLERRVAERTAAAESRAQELAVANSELEVTAKELSRANLQLSNEVGERKRAESELQAVHRQFVEAARRAGMAEVATGVLHNVGNVLNSVNVSATLVADRLRNSKLAELTRTLDLMEQHGAELGDYLTQDDRGKRVPGFLRLVATHMKRDHTAILDELGSLTKNVDHIKTIVAMQQSYAGAAGLVESVSLVELVDDAMRLNTSSFDRHHIKVIRDYADIPKVRIEKQKLLQILVNLITNAKDALLESNSDDHRLTVRIRVQQEADQPRVLIEVMDNGIGIPGENLKRIFSHGFTTKKHGHGFGLHSSANAAKELGGTLTAHSDGPERGALFTVSLPFNPIEVLT